MLWTSFIAHYPTPTEPSGKAVSAMGSIETKGEDARSAGTSLASPAMSYLRSPRPRLYPRMLMSLEVPPAAGT